MSSTEEAIWRSYVRTPILVGAVQWHTGDRLPFVHRESPKEPLLPRVGPPLKNGVYEGWVQTPWGPVGIGDGDYIVREANADLLVFPEEVFLSRYRPL